MKLIDIEKYVESNSDKLVSNAMTKDDGSTLNKFVINTIGDLLKGVNLDSEYQNSLKANLKKLNNQEVGEISMYIGLTPYVQAVLKDHSDFESKATYFLEVLISYIIGLTSREEFIKNLLEMKELLSLSDKFYNGIILYFSKYKEEISNGVIKRIA